MQDVVYVEYFLMVTYIFVFNIRFFLDEIFKAYREKYSQKQMVRLVFRREYHDLTISNLIFAYLLNLLYT